MNLNCYRFGQNLKRFSILASFHQANDFHGTQMNRGKIIILLILTAAIAVSGYGVWYRHHQMRRVLAAFSAPSAQQIAYAPETEILRLAAQGEATTGADHNIEIGHQPHSVLNRKVIHDSKGFSNLRADLVRDSSYDWTATEPAETNDSANWQYILVFRDGADEVRLAVDIDHCQIMLLNAGPMLSIAPICKAVTDYFHDQFPDPESNPAKAR